MVPSCYSGGTVGLISTVFTWIHNQSAELMAIM